MTSSDAACDDISKLSSDMLSFLDHSKSIIEYHSYLALYLTFYLAFYLALDMADLLTFYLAHLLTFCL